jgi:hypothetical protein
MEEKIERNRGVEMAISRREGRANDCKHRGEERRKNNYIPTTTTP